MAEKEKLDDPKTLEGVVVESVGDVKGDGTFTTVVAIPEAPPPPINPDDAIKAACERTAGGTRTGSGREGHDNETSPSKEWLSKLAEADARLSAAAAAADAAVKRRIDNSSTSSTT